jgi:hypothetical protein
MAAKPKTPIMEYAEEVKMVSVMRRVLSKHFPVLVNRGSRDKYYDSHPLGVSGPQPQRPPKDGHYGARKDGQLVKARATDIFLDADKEYEKKLGDALFEAFISLENRDQLGIDFVVWDKRKYHPVLKNVSEDKKVTDYPKPPVKCEFPKRPWKVKSCLHSDHLHVEFHPVKGDRDNSAHLEIVVAAIKKEIGTGP